MVARSSAKPKYICGLLLIILVWCFDCRREGRGGGIESASRQKFARFEQFLFLSDN